MMAGIHGVHRHVAPGGANRDVARWDLSGNEVTVTFLGGAISYRGTVTGNTITGIEMTNRPIPKTWRATRQNSGTASKATTSALADPGSRQATSMTIRRAVRSPVPKPLLALRAPTKVRAKPDLAVARRLGV